MKRKSHPINNFTMIENGLWQDPKISLGAKALYSYLSTYTHKNDKTCFPAKKKVRADLGIGETSLAKYKKELVDRGLLEVRKRFREDDGSQTSNTYCLMGYEEEKNKEETPPLESKEGPPIGIQGGFNNTHSEENPVNNLRSRRAVLAAAADNIPRPKSKKPRIPKQRSDTPVGRPSAVGWDVETLPASLRQKEVNTWNCNDMIRYHGHKWKLFFAKHPKQEIIPQHRSNMKQWLKQAGGEKARDTIRFVFENWEALQYRHKSLNTALPDLHVLIQYRASFEEDFQTNALAKTSGAEFDKSKERETGKEIGWDS